MLIKSILILCLYVFTKIEASEEQVQCDYYEGYPVTDVQLSYYRAMGAEENCTITIKPCDANEKFRRRDGSCNNLNRGCRGTYFEPMYRTLEAEFSDGHNPRKAKSGKELTLPRIIRTKTKREGYCVHEKLSSAVVAFSAFAFIDIGSVHDIEQFITYVTTTCDPAYKDDYWSTPVVVPERDTIGIMSNITCLNMTRPLYHQYYHCTEDPVPSPIVKATSAMDLSQIYNYYNNLEDSTRTYKDGLLLTETENGIEWPPNGDISNCIANEGNESRCYKNHLNGLPAINLVTFIFFNFHNYCARQLKINNPGWDDETIFQNARHINIAIYMKIFLYEYSRYLLGYENLIDAGILSENEGHRNLYNDSQIIANSLEYEYIQRLFHSYQPGILNLYDKEGRVYKQEKTPELVFRTGYLAIDNNLAGMLASLFRQSCANPECVDIEITERGLGKTQKSVDVISSDIQKGRYFGIKGYIYYLLHCFGVEVTSFEDLKQFMSTENIELLKEVYEDVSDIDLYVALGLEYHVEGGYVPITFACITKQFLHKLITSDRFYFERPGVFTEAQLAAIRNVTWSSLLCAVGEGVTEIQPNSFFNSAPGNEIVPCEEIPQLDFSPWVDSSCDSSE